VTFETTWHTRLWDCKAAREWPPRRSWVPGRRSPTHLALLLSEVADTIREFVVTPVPAWVVLVLVFVSFVWGGRA
jgi:hypothetical protein